jgi:26S proteasome regulatory subunit N8
LPYSLPAHLTPFFRIPPHFSLSPPQISAREKILGFYSTGPRIRVADTKIDALFRSSRYATRPLLLIVEVQPNVEGLPVQAYVTREEVSGGGRDLVRTFVHVPTEVGADDAEAVGVEHLLRDINNPSTSNLAGDIQGKVVGLKGLAARLTEVSVYLEKVLKGTLPQNNELLNQLQVRCFIFSLFPPLSPPLLLPHSLSCV